MATDESPDAVSKSTEAAKDSETAAVAGAGKKSKLILIGGIVGVLILVGGGGYFFMRSRSHVAEEPAATAAEADKANPAGKTAAGKAASASQGEPVFLGLDPAFVVNFQDDEALRFLQVGIQVMSHDKVAIDVVKAAEPVVRNSLVMLFSSQTYATLSTREGKERLRTDALTEVQKIVSEQIGRPGVEAVYFTSFVMQ